MKKDLVKISDEELKQLQSKSLEMAKYVISFCKERNIRCFFFAGSLLGAVRHKGFIPWDDDIDMNFPAPDFEKFIDAWEKEADKTRYSLCLQKKNYNDHTLTGSIRDNSTTYITDSTVDCDVNQGLAIDIEPFHACPNSRLGQMVQLLLASARSLFKAGRVPARQSKFVCIVSKILLGIFRTSTMRYYIWNILEKIATVADRRYCQSKYVREFTMFPYITWLYPREWFDNVEWVEFEDTKVPIPIGAKEYLKKRYGNYMELPPISERVPEARIIFMDLNTPYKEYRGIKYYFDDNK